MSRDVDQVHFESILVIILPNHFDSTDLVDNEQEVIESSIDADNFKLDVDYPRVE